MRFLAASVAAFVLIAVVFGLIFWQPVAALAVASTVAVIRWQQTR